VAPPEGGEVRVPAVEGSLLLSGIGCPFGAMPVYQLRFSTNGVVEIFLTRCTVEDEEESPAICLAKELAGLAVNHAIHENGICEASQSWVSCGDIWKYHAILPVSGLSATTDDV